MKSATESIFRESVLTKQERILVAAAVISIIALTDQGQPATSQGLGWCPLAWLRNAGSFSSTGNVLLLSLLCPRMIKELCHLSLPRKAPVLQLCPVITRELIQFRCPGPSPRECDPVGLGSGPGISMLTLTCS